MFFDETFKGTVVNWPLLSLNEGLLKKRLSLNTVYMLMQQLLPSFLLNNFSYSFPISSVKSKTSRVYRVITRKLK